MSLHSTPFSGPKLGEGAETSAGAEEEGGCWLSLGGPKVPRVEADGNSEEVAVMTLYVEEVMWLDLDTEFSARWI